MAKSLSERVASACTNDRVRLADLEALMTEATAERDREAGLVSEASAESVDFALPENLRDEAAACAERHGRNARALDSAIADLTGILQFRREGEAQKAADAAIAQVRTERAALVERIRAVA